MTLAATSVFAEFCLALEDYLWSDRDEQLLKACAACVAIEMKRRDLVAERLFHALRISACPAVIRDGNAGTGTVADIRYLRAVRTFLVCYFVV